VLGGNMRLKAAKECGLERIPIILADDWDQNKRDQFLIKDNVSYGEWNWEELKTDFSMEDIDSWGLDVPEFDTEEKPGSENNYSKKILAPIYQPVNDKPAIKDLFDIEKTKKLIAEIETSKLDSDVKKFLKLAAQRHTEFNYSKIADYYAHATAEVQDLMEKSALVIVDFNKAIENGFVRISQETLNQYSNDAAQ